MTIPLFCSFRHVIMDHVKNLRWHTAQQKDQKTWEKQINRKGFKVSKWTVVCSNHFSAGYYSPDSCNVPTLYMKGYNAPRPVKRKEPCDRTLPVRQAPKQSRNVNRYGNDDKQINFSVQTLPVNFHDYDEPPANEHCARCIAFTCFWCREKSKEITLLLLRIQKLEKDVKQLKEEKRSLQKKGFEIADVKGSAKLVLSYTGLQNYDIFRWLFNKIKEKAVSMNYVTSQGKRPGKGGPKRKLTLENEFFLTLVRLGLTEVDIACLLLILLSGVSKYNWYY